MNAHRETSNADTVAALYRAFGTGDIAFILDQLADDVSWDADWAGNSAQQAGVPHLQPRRGPAEVAEFFALLAEWKFNEFSVLGVIGDGRKVVAEVRSDVVLPGDHRIADEELHLWTFDDTGRVSAFRHYGDTAKHITAIANG